MAMEFANHPLEMRIFQRDEPLLMKLMTPGNLEGQVYFLSSRHFSAMKIQRDVVAPFALDVLSASPFPPQFYSRPHQGRFEVRKFLFLHARFFPRIHQESEDRRRSFTVFGMMPLSFVVMIQGPREGDLPF